MDSCSENDKINLNKIIKAIRTINDDNDSIKLICWLKKNTINCENYISKIMNNDKSLDIIYNRICSDTQDSEPKAPPPEPKIPEENYKEKLTKIKDSATYDKEQQTITDAENSNYLIQDRSIYKFLMSKGLLIQDNEYRILKMEYINNDKENKPIEYFYVCIIKKNIADNNYSIFSIDEMKVIDDELCYTHADGFNGKEEPIIRCPYIDKIYIADENEANQKEIEILINKIINPTTGGKKSSKHQKKEILGKVRCIYKIFGSKKDHVKHKGNLITVTDYKKIMKPKTNK